MEYERNEENEMKKRFLAILLTTSLVLTITACSGSDKSTNTETETVETTTENETIEVDENLLTVELTIPADYVGETTQEELDAIAKENDFKSITLNEDGSATYVMTKGQHKELMSEMAKELNATLSEMIGSEDYPNFTNIEANSDFTKFTITTTSAELDFNESFSTIAFYMYGGMYNAFNGTEVDNIHVDFVNADSGEIISSADSSESE